MTNEAVTNKAARNKDVLISGASVAGYCPGPAVGGGTSCEHRRAQQGISELRKRDARVGPTKPDHWPDFDDGPDPRNPWAGLAGQPADTAPAHGFPRTSSGGSIPCKEDQLAHSSRSL